MTEVETSIPATHESSSSEYTPSDREVVAAVINLWKEEPGSESLGNAKLHALVKKHKPTWSLSAARLKNLLKTFGLQTNTPLFQYAGETTSHPTPDLELPAGVKLVVTKSRGKALYSSRAFKTGEEIWSEPALVLIAPMDHITLMRKCLACAHCSRPFQVRASAGGAAGVARGGAECTSCPAQWCNVKCKKVDITHSAHWHKTAHSKIKHPEWLKYEQFCVDNQWQAAYSYGQVLLSILLDPSKTKLRKQIDAMAKVRQDVRQKAVTPASSGFGGANLEQEQTEQLWTEGHKLLQNVVNGIYDLSYEEYLYGIGMVNINNLDGSIYLTQSHLNHACIPNVDVQITGRTSGIKVVAKRDIRAGEELFTTYVNPSDDVDARRYQLRVNWGFLCACARCKEEEKLKLAPETRPRRKSVRFDEATITAGAS